MQPSQYRRCRSANFAGRIAFSAALAISIAFCDILRPVSAQTNFVDDAQRTVVVPKTVARTFAAGTPAEVLLYTFAPQTMVGRNHLPSQAALEFMPAKLRNPTAIAKLPRAQDASNDMELLALKPDLYVDYGDLHDDYINAVTRVQERTRVPSVILDGALNNIPATYLRLGTLLNMRQRAAILAEQSEFILAKYRNFLLKPGKPPRVYLACSFDAVIPCLSGERNGEVAEFLGATNVAGDVNASLPKPLTINDIQSWNPEAIIAANADAVTRIQSNAAWQAIAAVKNHRVYSAPTLPFGWGSRPPSVNRLPGMIWLAYVLSGREFDKTFVALIAFCAGATSSVSFGQAASGDPAKGKALFQERCEVCHAIAPDGAAQGPNLVGVIGRTSAAIPGFGYTKELRDAKLVWNEATLDKYSANPGSSTCLIPPSLGIFECILRKNSSTRRLSTCSRQQS